MFRNFALQSYFSYKGLFFWSDWTSYISNVFVMPVALAVMLALTGRFAGESGRTDYFIVGMAVYAIPVILNLGILSSFYFERVFGTLSLIYASPTNRWMTYWGKGVFHYPNGVLSASVTLFFGWVLLDLQISAVNWATLVVLVLLISFSCMAFALFLGNLTIVFREWFIGLMAGNGIFLALTGVIIPTDELPYVLEAIGQILPLTHGLPAFRDAFVGSSLGAVRNDIVLELVVGLVYLLAGAVIFKLLEFDAKKRGIYESAI